MFFLKYVYMTYMERNIDNKKTINILEILLIIVKRWWLIAILTILAGLFSVIYTFTLKDKFESYVEIEIRSGNKTNIADLENNPLIMIDSMTESMLTRTTKDAEIYAHIAKTPRIIDKIIQKNDLKKVYNLSTMENVRDKFIKKTKILVNELGLLEIRYEDNDKYLVYQIIKDYITELQNYYRWRSQELIRSNLDEISDIIIQINQEISDTKDKLKIFQEKYGIFDLDIYAGNLSKQIAELKMQLIQSQLEYNFRYSEYKRLGKTTMTELSFYKDKINIIQNTIDNLNNVTYKGQIAYNDLPKANSEYIEISINLKSLYKIYEQLQQLYNITKLNINKNVETMVIVIEPEIAEFKFYPYKSKIVLKFIFIVFFFSIFLCFIMELFENFWKNKEDKKYILKMIEYFMIWKKFIKYIPFYKKK
jgi:uncharacterized protein involved in exopolysaccharide biosynthesis